LIKIIEQNKDDTESNLYNLQRSLILLNFNSIESDMDLIKTNIDHFIIQDSNILYKDELRIIRDCRFSESPLEMIILNEKEKVRTILNIFESPYLCIDIRLLEEDFKNFKFIIENQYIARFLRTFVENKYNFDRHDDFTTLIKYTDQNYHDMNMKRTIENEYQLSKKIPNVQFKPYNLERKISIELDTINISNEFFDKIKLKTPKNLKNTYCFNPSSQELTDQLEEFRQQDLEDLNKNQDWRFFCANNQLYRTIGSKLQTQNIKISQKIYTCPITNITVIHPNQTSGDHLTPLTLLCEHKLNKGEQKKIKSRTLFNDLDFIKGYRGKYAISMPFDENPTWINQQVSQLGGILCSIHMFLSHNVNPLQSRLFLSRYYKFSLRHISTTDIIYLFYKNAHQTASFGKGEIKPKLEAVKWTCPVSITILYKLKQNYNKFCTSLYNQLQNKNSIEKVEDPIFSWDITNLEVFLATNYLKQLFLKMIGKDTPQSYADLFSGELKIQKEYDESPFKILDKDYRLLRTDEFVDMLFKNPEKWTSTSWDTMCCALASMILSISNKLENKPKEYESMITTKAGHTGKSRSVTVSEIMGIHNSRNKTTDISLTEVQDIRELDKDKIIKIEFEENREPDNLKIDDSSYKALQEFIDQMDESSEEEDTKTLKNLKLEGLDPNLVNNKGRAIFDISYESEIKEKIQNYINNLSKGIENLSELDKLIITRSPKLRNMYKNINSKLTEYIGLATKFLKENLNIGIMKLVLRRGKNLCKLRQLTPEIFRKMTYSSVTTLKLTDAIMLEIQNVSEITGLQETLVAMTKLIEFINLGLMPNMEELTTLSMMINPRFTILIQWFKDQLGWPTRAFQIQTVANRNNNVIIDYIGRNLLDSKENISDIIRIPGLQKNLKFQDDMEKISKDNNSHSDSIDMTKYGDSYHLIPIFMMLVSYYIAGNITILHMIKYCEILWTIGKRLLLLPEKVRSKIENEINGIRIDTIQKDRKTFIDKISNLNKIAELAFGDLKNDLRSSLFSNVITDDTYIIRTVGWVLGVLNMLGSVGSTSITLTQTEVLRRLFGSNILKSIKSYTQSDDGMDLTTLPLINSKEEWEEIDVMEYVKNHDNSYFIDPWIWYITKKEGETIQLPMHEKMITKLFMCIRLLSCKLFSQRPSMLKTSWGFYSEMLQELHTKAGTLVPLIRYTSSICNDLNSDNLTNDLMGGLSKITDMISAGGNLSTIHCCMVTLNDIVNRIYGDIRQSLSDDNLGLLPIEIGGLFYLTRSDFVEFGNQGNLLRLINCSDLIGIVTGEWKYANLLNLNVNVPSFWRDKKDKIAPEITIF
jgi:hypothetical protein